MGVTHDSLAVQAFKRQHGRAPTSSANRRSPEEAWMQSWKAGHLVKRCRDPAYASYFAKRIASLALRRFHGRRLVLVTPSPSFPCSAVNGKV